MITNTDEDIPTFHPSLNVHTIVILPLNASIFLTKKHANQLQWPSQDWHIDMLHRLRAGWKIGNRYMIKQPMENDSFYMGNISLMIYNDPTLEGPASPALPLHSLKLSYENVDVISYNSCRLSNVGLKCPQKCLAAIFHLNPAI